MVEETNAGGSKSQVNGSLYCYMRCYNVHRYLFLPQGLHDTSEYTHDFGWW
jgi:hypothetical protein